MQKRNPFTFCSEARSFVDEPNAHVATLGEHAVEVINSEAEVMDSRASLGYELADWRIAGFGLE
jgi:hypothetical protein